ncbi:hypothetical protein KIPB_005575, partial [Kipferlia bialata]|eukprot:g5575.t1
MVGSFLEIELLVRYIGYIFYNRTQYEILLALLNHGRATPDKISSHSRLSQNQAESALALFFSHHLVTKQSRDEKGHPVLEFVLDETNIGRFLFVVVKRMEIIMKEEGQKDAGWTCPGCQRVFPQSESITLYDSARGCYACNRCLTQLHRSNVKETGDTPEQRTIRASVGKVLALAKELLAVYKKKPTEIEDQLASVLSHFEAMKRNRPEGEGHKSNLCSGSGISKESVEYDLDEEGEQEQGQTAEEKDMWNREMAEESSGDSIDDAGRHGMHNNGREKKKKKQGEQDQRGQDALFPAIIPPPAAMGQTARDGSQLP